MANNRLYVVVREDDDPPREILLAKGWSTGWQIWEPETLVARLEALLRGVDIGATTGSAGTVVSIEDENHQKDSPELIRAGGDAWKANLTITSTGEKPE